MDYAKLLPDKDRYQHGDNVTLQCKDEVKPTNNHVMTCIQGNWLALLPFHHCSSGRFWFFLVSQVFSLVFLYFIYCGNSIS